MAWSRSVRNRLLRLLVVVSATAASCTVGMVTADPSSGSALDAGPTDVFQTPDLLTAKIDGLTDQLGQIGESSPSFYAGLSVTADHEINIYLTPGASALAVALSSLPLSGVPLKFITVPNSLQVLDSVSDQIKSHRTEWAARGVDIVQWGPGATDDKVDVMVDDLTSTAANQLTATYGNSLVAVKPSPYQSRPEEYSGRYDDSSPWNGGIAINWSHNTSGQPPADCTTGANAISSTGRKYLITAGHCAAVGDRFYNHNTLLGTVTKRTYVQNGEADAEMIPVPTAAGAAGLIYDGYDLFGGDYAHSSLVTAVRTARDAIGDKVCYDGANSGQLCGAEVTKVKQCIVFMSGHVTCDLTQTTRVLPAATGGDSGSPVYNGTGDRTVTIRGQLVGGSGNIDFYCREYWITHYLGVKVIVS